jgi:CMP-N-acetylneuraminic acid synthetase
MTCIGMIPVRIGSERLRQKNLIELYGRPLMSYAIETACKAKVFDRVVVNGDDPVFEKIAKEWGGEFYLRPKPLGGSEVQSDDVVADFCSAYSADIVAWVNTTTPLMSDIDIRNAMVSFQKQELDSMITTEMRNSHAVLDKKPINFRTDERFARTQDLPPIELFNYALMAWRRDVFLNTYAGQGHAFFCGRFGTVPISKVSGLMVKTREDISIIEAMLSLLA